MVEKFISVRETAQQLGVSEKKIIDLVEEGRIPAYKIGGEFLRFKKDQIDEIKKAGLVKREIIHHEYTNSERIKDFFAYNDFYILCTTIILGLLFIIFF